MIIQIYEIQTPGEAEKCIELGVDHLGSVLLSQDEWRLQVLREVTRMSERADVKTGLIPLFQHPDTLYRVIDYYRPNYIHFCESLTGAEGREVELTRFIEIQSSLKQRFPEIGIMRSIPIPESGSASQLPSVRLVKALEPFSDVFLIDTWLGKEPVAGYVGITGITGDREAAKNVVLQSGIPVILAGGLSPENVREAILEVLPAGVDSCTQTNCFDEAGKPLRFKKDFQKVEKFVKEIQNAEAQIKIRRDDLEKKMGYLKAELREREASLPAHSVRPQQLLAIEELEDEIVVTERQIEDLKKVFKGGRNDSGGGPGKN